MRGIDDALKKSISGPKAERKLNEFRRQVEAWGLSMPPADPLVLDFGLGEFDNVGLLEYWIANEVEAGYCGKYMFVFDRQQCILHSHRVKHETFFLVRGRVKVILDGRTIILEPGDVLPIQPGK